MIWIAVDLIAVFAALKVIKYSTVIQQSASSNGGSSIDFLTHICYAVAEP